MVFVDESDFVIRESIIIDEPWPGDGAGTAGLLR